jgi:uncharacterized damage-inducible protein DinB
MSVGITLDELLVWNREASGFWNDCLGKNPAVLGLPCGIGGAADVQQFVRHVWGAELRWSQRLAGLPVIDKDAVPSGPLEALFALHVQAQEIFRGLLSAPDESWEQPYVLDFAWVPQEARTMSRRKIALHALIHSHRHWAQLATLVRNAGFSSGFKGDLIFSHAMQ